MRCLLLVLFLGAHLIVFGQTDTTRRADTIAVEKGFSILPGMTPRPLQQSSHSMLDASLKETGQPGLGISVFNALRGRVPGVNIDPYYQIDTLTWRNSSPLVVIDGVVFNQNIRGFYNLNAFEYDEMQMILGRNGTIPYGGTGNSGAVVLHSRNGEGFSKPVLDFNTYTTYAWGNDPSTSQWQLSNSLAYSQDFGKVDLRVSTNYTIQPPGTSTNDGPEFFSLRVNTGLSLSKFTARLILNGNSAWLNQTFSYSLPGWPTVTGSNSETNDLFQGNLTLSYVFTDWLSISAQASRTKLISERESTTNLRTTENQYDAANVLLNVNKKLSSAFTVTGSVGMIANHSGWQTNGSSTSGYTLNREYKASTNSLLATTEIGFREKLFTGMHFRRDFVHLLQSEAYNLYSFFGSYSFHHLIDPSNKVLSFAKIRTSFGHNDNVSDYTVPSLSTFNPYPSKNRTSSFEVGLDAGFLRNRIQFMANYYQNKNLARSPTVAPIDPVTGYTITYTNLGSYTTTVNGFEFLVRMKVMETKDLSLTTQLIAGWNTQVMEQSTPLGSGVIVLGGPPINIPRSTGNSITSMPSPLPDWTGGWLNQATMGRFSVSMLIDISAGGYFYQSSLTSLQARSTFTPIYTPDSLISIGAANYGFSVNNYTTQSLSDRTFVKLRDVAVSYNLSLFNRMKGFVSLSFRNLLVLYSGSGVDPESDPSTTHAPLNKSMSVSFNLQF